MSYGEGKKTIVSYGSNWQKETKGDEFATWRGMSLSEN